MRWLVTGGCGFIGRRLIHRLLADPQHDIRILDNYAVGTPGDVEALVGNEITRLDFIEGDIRDDGVTSQAAEGRDVIVHLAGNTGVVPSIADPRTDCITNVIGTLNMLEACRERGVRRLVFASSAATVGDGEPPLHEEMPTRPFSPYGAGKLAGEAYCFAYRHGYGIETVALRFGNCYGPNSGHKDNVIAKFIREALAGETWRIYGDGAQTRDFIYVDDIVEAVGRAATVQGIGGELFQIATSRETTITELAQSLKQILRGHSIPVAEPVHVSPLAGEVRRNYSDTRKARERLGWTARTPLAEGLARTVDWFLAQRR
jgi:UDP-glucose 4-epimerase